MVIAPPVSSTIPVIIERFVVSQHKPLLGHWFGWQGLKIIVTVSLQQGDKEIISITYPCSTCITHFAVSGMENSLPPQSVLGLLNQYLSG